MGHLIFHDSSDPNTANWYEVPDTVARVLEQVIEGVLAETGSVDFFGHDPARGDKTSVGFPISRAARPIVRYDSEVEVDTELVEQVLRYARFTGRIVMDENENPVVDLWRNRR